VTTVRLHRIAHWAGIALALPVLAAAALGLALWFDGLPPTFTAADGILVLAALGLVAAAVYGFCRGIGYAILWLLTPTGPPGRS
jgi:hypothetical protein